LFVFSLLYTPIIFYFSFSIFKRKRKRKPDKEGGGVPASFAAQKASFGSTLRVYPTGLPYGSFAGNFSADRQKNKGEKEKIKEETLFLEREKGERKREKSDV
jgi:hypothetical protein